MVTPLATVGRYLWPSVVSHDKTTNQQRLCAGDLYKSASIIGRTEKAAILPLRCTSKGSKAFSFSGFCPRPSDLSSTSLAMSTTPGSLPALSDQRLFYPSSSPPSRTIPKTRPVSKFHKIPRLSNEVQLDVLLSWTMTIRLRTTTSTASLQTVQEHISLRKIMHVALQISNFVPHIFSIGLYTVSPKKLCKFVFVRTSSNFHQFW